MDWLVLFSVYIIGFVITLLVLIKYGKTKFGFDYDEPKTYVNYDDYDSNAQAYIWAAICWMIVLPMYLLFTGFKKLEHLVQKQIDKG